MPGLEEFEGAWRLERDIIHADGAVARFEGRAVWSRDGAGLTYRESGELAFAGQTAVRAERCYLWRTRPDGCIGVHFTDGRPFHRIVPERPVDRHFCEPDLYDVEYDFSAWPLWSCRWIVRGPRKDYRMTSTFSPEDG